MNNIKPKLMGGIGEINFGKQYRQGNRIYDAAAIAMCVLAQPVGNTGGYSYLYLVKRHNQERKREEKVVKVGNLSTGSSQASSHGYAIGYIVVKRKNKGDHHEPVHKTH